MKPGQYGALTQLVEALRACKAEGVCITVPGRDYVILEGLAGDGEVIDLSPYSTLDPSSLDRLLTR